MIDKLYQKTILKHAANATAHGILEDADHSVMVHNPMCGDRIKVFIKMDGDKLVSFTHEAKACALCQASASVLGEHYHGLDKTTLTELVDKIMHSLSDANGPDLNSWPDDQWSDLDVFNVVRDHKSRQTCVTLPFDALLQAMNECK
ncbi:MAG: iron-sulfur cluster assembly scaffold protein [Kordiimonadaceae bacterium]|mgnify:CR=1 FL=1|jgi:nitrogen fixation protein NifU and related proteins|nr:iron-sulfur cluster assembly scaffold protein [Kordiimonadaceae bacterium]MBT6037395.1 iron-sulfur cluster assembly scaffold protein [Kordiimonadaceae bacterium]MBT6329102.1 iron-sulfur cluster assembly scaffold protein [Kordiimonadaceae bacterium]MBT7581870.1 iron-sulfur cluster assembly scaffold protein [Kordiimonadaceae bacterium]